nr:hypothetical protein [Micromonospora sp. DSM 115978]
MSDYYSGQCIVQSRQDFASGLTEIFVDIADERITVTGELVGEIESGRAHPDVTIKGGVLQIAAVNRTVRYRLLDQSGPVRRAELVQT